MVTTSPVSKYTARPRNDQEGGRESAATPPSGPAPTLLSVRSMLARIRAWMVVLPVDAAALAAPGLWAPRHSGSFLALAVLGVVFITGGARYRARLHTSVLDELPTLLGRLLVAVAMVAVVTALWHQQEAVTNFLSSAVWALMLVVAGRICTTQAILFARRRHIARHRTLLIGFGPIGNEVAGILRRKQRYGLSVVGYVDDAAMHDTQDGLHRLGGLSDIEEVVRSHNVSVIICADVDFFEREIIGFVRRHAAGRCDLFVVPRLHQLRTEVGHADHVDAVPVVRIRTPSLRGPAWLVKRGFDILLGAVLLACSAPILLALSIAVRIEGGPGVLFRQDRVGRDGNTFECLKFRSMRPTNHDESETRWNIANDDRIGRVGRLLRRTSLDEVPQILNIFNGNMTFVGPRPERPFFVRKFSAEFPGYDQRLRAQAGLTGLAQVNGLRGDTSISDRARFDNYYIDHWSLWLDVKILIRTAAEVLLIKGK